MQETNALPFVKVSDGRELEQISEDNNRDTPLLARISVADSQAAIAATNTPNTAVTWISYKYDMYNDIDSNYMYQ